MTSKDVVELNLSFQKSTVEAINSYCRVLELQIRAVAEGANPLATGSIRTITGLATTGLEKELEFLASLRKDMTGEVEGMASPGEKSKPNSSNTRRT